MKTIKLKENHIKGNSEHYIEDYLQTLGIAAEDVNSFIDMPREQDQDNPWKLRGINQAIQILDKFKSGNVFIIVDPDCDGFTSSAILINYLKRRFPEMIISYHLPTGKEHGVVINTVPENADLVIIPDAGSNQGEEVMELHRKGKAVIILDHHEVNAAEAILNDMENYALVNNQISDSFNKCMSGAGVTYMFCKAMDEYLNDGINIAKDYMDLAAIGIIADAMNMANVGNNYLAYYGLRNIRSQLIKEIALKQARGIKDPEALTKIDVAFYIAPVINGVIRSGDEYDKRMVFRALTEEDNKEIFHHEWRGKVTEETLFQHAARLAANAKSRQDSGKKKSFEWLCGKIEENGWNKDNLIIATMDEKESLKVNANVTGLIAMELCKHYNRPCLVLRQTEYEGKKVYGGSGRNGNFYGLNSLLDFLKKSNLTYYAEGHANAFGTFIEPLNVEILRDYANKTINPQIFDDTIFEVDYWFHTGERINKNMLFEFASYDGLYGNSIPQPKFAFDINFKSTDVKIMGADSSSVKITIDGIGFVAFKNKELVEKISKLEFGHAQIVGRPQLNEWMGSVGVQIMIDDIELTSILNDTPKVNIMSLL